MQNECYRRVSFSQRATALALALLIALQAGCARATRPAASETSEQTQAALLAEQPPLTQFQPNLGRVAVVAVAELPDTLLGGNATGRNPDSPGRNAFSSCMRGGGGCGGNLGVCAGLIVAALVICGIVGGVAGASAGETTAGPVITSGNPEVPAAVDAKIVQGALRDQIVAAARASGVKLAMPQPESMPARRSARDYRALDAQGVDTVLEVELTHALGTYGYTFSSGPAEQVNPSVPLEMRAHVRLVRARDNSLIYYRDYIYRGKTLHYNDWTADHAHKLARALERGYEALGHDISDSIFLLYPDANRPDDEGQMCGLAPLAPKDDMATDLAPTLEWQSFPRPADRSAAPKDIARIKNVKYDLIIGIGNNRESFDVIYRREGLAKPSHRVEMPLQPNARYFWSVRARFTLDGRQRVTEWATRCPFEPQLIVGGRLFRFYTPDV